MFIHQKQTPTIPMIVHARKGEQKGVAVGASEPKNDHVSCRMTSSLTVTEGRTSAQLLRADWCAVRDDLFALVDAEDDACGYANLNPRDAFTYSVLNDAPPGLNQLNSRIYVCLPNFLKDACFVETMAPVGLANCSHGEKLSIVGYSGPTYKDSEAAINAIYIIGSGQTLAKLAHLMNHNLETGSVVDTTSLAQAQIELTRCSHDIRLTMIDPLD
jgi:hypothetical protein